MGFISPPNQYFKILIIPFTQQENYLMLMFALAQLQFGIYSFIKVFILKNFLTILICLYNEYKNKKEKGAIYNQRVFLENNDNNQDIELSTLEEGNLYNLKRRIKPLKPTFEPVINTSQNEIIEDDYCKLKYIIILKNIQNLSIINQLIKSFKSIFQKSKSINILIDNFGDFEEYQWRLCEIKYNQSFLLRFNSEIILPEDSIIKKYKEPAIIFINNKNSTGENINIKTLIDDEIIIKAGTIITTINETIIVKILPKKKEINYSLITLFSIYLLISISFILNMIFKINYISEILLSIGLFIHLFFFQSNFIIMFSSMGVFAWSFLWKFYLINSNFITIFMFCYKFVPIAKEPIILAFSLKMANNFNSIFPKITINNILEIFNLVKCKILLSDKTGTITHDTLTLGICNLNNFNHGLFNHSIFIKDEKYVGCQEEILLYKYINSQYSNNNIKIINEFPFDESIKLSGVIIYNINNNNYTLLLKGPKEKIISIFKKNNINLELNNDYDNIRNIHYISAPLDNNIMRENYTLLELLNNYKLDFSYDGIVTFNESIRKNIKETFDCFKRVIILSGDSKGNILSLLKNLNMTDFIFVSVDEFSKISTKYKKIVVYRCSPEDKKNIALKIENMFGRCCAIGDGKNDIPMINKVTCGISMGDNIEDCGIANIKDSFIYLKQLIDYSKRLNELVYIITDLFFCGILLFMSYMIFIYFTKNTFALNLNFEFSFYIFYVCIPLIIYIIMVDLVQTKLIKNKIAKNLKWIILLPIFIYFKERQVIFLIISLLMLFFYVSIYKDIERLFNNKNKLFLIYFIPMFITIFNVWLFY